MTSNSSQLDAHQYAAAAYVKQYLTEHQQQGGMVNSSAPLPAAPLQPQLPQQHQILSQYLSGLSSGSAAASAAPICSLAPTVAAGQYAGVVGASAHTASLVPQQSQHYLIAEYLKAQQLQQQQQGITPVVATAAPTPTPAAGSLPPNLLATLQAAASGGSPPAPRPVPVSVAPSLAQAAQVASISAVGPSAAQQQQQLLASAQLLSTVNPGLAAAAMAQALAMGNPNPLPPPLVVAASGMAPASTASQQPTLTSTANGLHHHQQQQQPQPVLTPAHVLLPSSQHMHPAAVAPQLQQPPILSAGVAAAAAQYRQLQASRRPSSVGLAPTRQQVIHSNRSSPGVPPAAGMAGQKHSRPGSALAVMTSAPLPTTMTGTGSSPSSSLVHPVSSSGSSTNTGPVASTVVANKASAKSSAAVPLQQQQATMSRTASIASGSSPGSKNLSPNNSMPSLAHSSAKQLSAVPKKLSSTKTGSAVGLVRPTVPSSRAASSASAIHHHRGHHSAAVATAATSSGVPSRSTVPPHVSITAMQRWSLEQLDAHAKQLRDAGQSVPQALALLVADTRRKEEKRHAKRLANRKSACTSRARKKALIEEMTKENARLRRQALILSYLPDPVVAISTDGIITFCSMQVERVLNHNMSGLIGANIEDIIVPSSRESIRRLIGDLVIAEQRAFSSSVEDGESGGENQSHQNVGGSDGSARGNNALPHEVSEHSSELSRPPLLEVKVKAGRSSTVAAGEDVSDSSGDPPSKNGQAKTASDVTTPTEMSSLTHKNSSFGPESSSLDQAQPPAKKAKIDASATEQKKQHPSESDESTSSANKASANLTKNVEMCKLNKDKKEGSEQVGFAHKDDVMGASVTANNAGAKLSSLMHHPSEKEEGSGGDVSPSDTAAAATATKPDQPEEPVASIRRKHVLGPKMPVGKQEEQSASSADSSLSKTKKRSGNSSEDSGYRESNESPEGSDEYAEDSSSSGASSERSSSNKKKRKRARPLAPACNVRLIRNDLSTIWCELTSSIRTRPLNDIDEKLNIVPPSQLKQGGNQKSSNNNFGSSESAVSSESEQEEKELLLCFRPIREGEKVGEELRFSPKSSVSEKTDGSDESPASSDGPKVSSSSSNTAGKPEEAELKKAASSSTYAPSSTETQAAAAPPAPSPKKNRPPKKRKFECEEENEANNTKSSQDTQVDDNNKSSEDTQSAVESMMTLAGRA